MVSTGQHARVSQVQAMHPHSCWWHSPSFQGVMERARTAGSVKTECWVQQQSQRFHHAADYQPEDKGAMCRPVVCIGVVCKSVHRGSMQGCAGSPAVPSVLLL